MKLAYFGLALAFAALLGCENPEVFQEKRITMEVVGVKVASKTNSTVDLREVGTGTVHYRQKLKCGNDAKRVKIGSRWDVTEITYHYPASHQFTSELVGVRAICEKSK